VINEKPEFSLKRKIASWLFILTLISIISYVAFNALLESYFEGIMKRPYIWIGIVTWCLVGYYFYEIKLFFSKNKPFYGIIFLGFCMSIYYLAMSGKFPAIFEWAIPAIISPVIAMLRGLIVEVVLKKDK